MKIDENLKEAEKKLKADNKRKEQSFAVQRQNPLAEILPLLRPFGYANLSNKVLTQLLLYGDKNILNDVNRNILELTLQFIKETGRLD